MQPFLWRQFGGFFECEHVEQIAKTLRGSPSQAFHNLVKVDRVEWITMPDAQTAVNALQSGDIDFMENPAFDILPVPMGLTEKARKAQYRQVSAPVKNPMRS